MSPTLADFVSCFYIEENRRIDADALDFSKHLVTRVKRVAEDTPTPQVPEELQLYNPLKTGVAYYFTNSGAKIRNARKCSIDDKSMGKDDHLSTATYAKLKKHKCGVFSCCFGIAKAARKSTTFMFL